VCVCVRACPCDGAGVSDGSHGATEAGELDRLFGAEPEPGHRGGLAPRQPRERECSVALWALVSHTNRPALHTFVVLG